MTEVLKEVRDLLKEILSELKKQKEPTEVTVDSKKLMTYLEESSTNNSLNKL